MIRLNEMNILVAIFLRGKGFFHILGLTGVMIRDVK